MISTHVLDTERGEPAADVIVELYRGEELLATAQTDADGRIAELSPQPLETGAYRIVFHPPSTFFRRVDLEIVIEDPQRHHHIPLLVSPYSCASYRGS